MYQSINQSINVASTAPLVANSTHLNSGSRMWAPQCARAVRQRPHLFADDHILEAAAPAGAPSPRPEVCTAGFACQAVHLHHTLRAAS